MLIGHLNQKSNRNAYAYYLVLNYLKFPQNARENNIVNPKMVVKFTILVPYT